jgi:hypothetical protein
MAALNAAYRAGDFTRMETLLHDTATPDRNGPANAGATGGNRNQQGMKYTAAPLAVTGAH